MRQDNNSNHVFERHRNIRGHKNSEYLEVIGLRRPEHLSRPFTLRRSRAPSALQEVNPLVASAPSPTRWSVFLQSQSVAPQRLIAKLQLQAVCHKHYFGSAQIVRLGYYSEVVLRRVFNTNTTTKKEEGEENKELRDHNIGS